MSLHPTPTRLRRLRDVRQGWIARYGDGHDWHHGTSNRVTAVMAEMERAGWVQLADQEAWPGKRLWELTDAGRAELARHREATR